MRNSAPPEEAVSDHPPVQVNPFPGPRAYKGEQEHYFFGRDEEIGDMTALVLSTSTTLLYAPSGTGKSSLLRAGVAPNLEHRFGFVVMPVVQLGRGDRLESSVHEGPNQFVKVLCETISDSGTPARYDIAEVASSFRTAESRVLLILDQFEEVLDDPALTRDREEFFTELTQALAQNTWLRVVIALRSDYLAHLVPYERHLPSNLTVRYQLESLTEEQAQEAITCAFAESGVDLPEEVLATLLDALLEDPLDAGPTAARAQHVNTVQLQIACRRLWNDLSDAGRTGRPLDANRAILGLRTSMMDFVDEAVNEAVRGKPVQETAVRWWLNERLITTDSRRAFVHVGEKATAGLPNDIVRALEHARLIQLEQRHGSRLAELTHDSMVEGVQASNERRSRERYRRYRRRRAGLATLLVGLIGVLLILHRGASGIESLESREFRVGIIQNGEAREMFRSRAEGVVVELQPVQKPVTLRIARNRPGPADPPPVDIPQDSTGPTTIAVPTGRNFDYTMTMTSGGLQSVPYSLTLTDASVMAVNDLERRNLIASSRVIIQLPSGRRETVHAVGSRITQVAGANVLDRNVDSDWVIMEGPGNAVLSLTPDEDNYIGAATVRRKILDETDPMRVGETRTRLVEPGKEPGRIAYFPIEAGNRAMGAEVRCSDSVRARVVGDGTQRSANGDNLHTAGPEGTVLPIVKGLAPSGLVLSDDSGTEPVECRVNTLPPEKGTIKSFGRQVLSVADRSSAVFPVSLAADAVIVADQSNEVKTALQCGSRVERPATQSLRLVALAQRGSSCGLWIVKTDPSRPTVSISIEILKRSRGGGG